MKTETRRRRQKSRARAPILFPRPAVVPPKPEPEPEPEPETKTGVAPVLKQGIIDHAIVLRTWSHDEEKVLDRRHFPEYGLEKIPVSTEPHRVTWRGILRQIRFALRAPVGARRSVVRPRKDWTS